MADRTKLTKDIVINEQIKTILIDPHQPILNPTSANHLTNQTNILIKQSNHPTNQPNHPTNNTNNLTTTIINHEIEPTPITYQSKTIRINQDIKYFFSLEVIV